MSSDSLGDRMKGYESVPKYRLTPRTPVMMRLDGRAFHTFTRRFERPFDLAFNVPMWMTARYLCKNIAGARLAYVQSDEISLLLADWRSQNTQPWFDYEVQKLCSIGAAMATAEFSRMMVDTDRVDHARPGAFPQFDCRVWNLPPSEVVNYFIWRQQDATRNSISSLAQSKFLAKELHCVNTGGMQDMLMAQHGVNWNDCPIPQKRGVCIRKSLDAEGHWTWLLDEAIPVFTQDRGYVEQWLSFPEDSDE